jgi:glycosyltransferase involved in cell wall biosynthesis
MDRTPLVSVIIPTYNRAEMVCRAIDSALSQTYTNKEIIVVDDGSTDQTPDRLAAYGHRIRTIAQGNAGPSSARNRGIAAAAGEIVAFLDSDDYWLPSKLARQVELLQRAGDSVPCCLCNCTIVYRDGSRSSSFKVAATTPNRPAGLWLNPAEVLSTRFLLFNQAVAIRRAALDRAGHFDESLLFAEDYELALRLALQEPWTIMRDELTVCHAANPDSLGGRALREETRFREGLIRMWKQMLKMVEADPRHSYLGRTVLRQVRREERALLAAQLKQANSSGALLAARLLRLADRAWDGWMRRSPQYPQPLVSDLN